MSSGRQPPMGTPQLSTHAGLTPQMAIVDANGRPTMFFFRWLLTIGGAALTSDDLSILESFDPGADAALAESAIADAFDRAQLAAGFDVGAARADLLARLEDLAIAGAMRARGLGSGPSADQRVLEALLIADAPLTPATPIAVLADTLANWTLAKYNPANYAAGQPFLVTTWQVTYAVEGGLWTYVSGTYIAPAASRPATAFNGAALGVLDIGLQFLASDTGAFQYWSGSAWVPIGATAAPIGPAGGDLAGNYPNPTIKATVAFTPAILIGGSAAGITFSSTATSTRTGTGAGSPVTVAITVNVSAWPASPVGTVTITGVPVLPIGRITGTFVAQSGFTGMTAGTPVVLTINAGGVITLNTPGAAGVTPLSPTVFTSAAIFTILLSYLSAA
jgi:hypothetical protein